MSPAQACNNTLPTPLTFCIAWSFIYDTYTTPSFLPVASATAELDLGKIIENLSILQNIL
jgi:hypothetical protein